MKVENLAFLIIFLKCGLFVNAAKILGLFPYGLKSHYAVFDPLMMELAKRGHNVTVVNPFPKNDVVENYKEIDVKDCATRHSMSITQMASITTSIFTLADTMAARLSAFDQLLTCKIMKDLMKSEEKYDLLMFEIFTSDVPVAFFHKFQAPFISFSANSMYPWACDRTGNPDNPSYVTVNHNFYPPDLKNTFFDRLYNTFVYLVIKYNYYTRFQVISQNIVDKHFGTSPKIDISQIVKDTSMIFTYSHFSLNQALPVVPQVVEVSGIQIKESSPLPEDIEKFINESKHGVIYFCLGSLLQAQTLPNEKRDAFLYAFSRIPQRVIWKWEADSMPGKLDNVLLRKWLPQRDILAHPNVKLFIAHGGALGINEAVYEGVPILGIPIFADQTINIKSVQSAGAGKLLAYKDVSNETVLENIELILNNFKEYKKNAMELSSRYKDRPMSPLDTAVYWTEYVIRHKGAHHLKSAAVDMPWYQYFLLDVIATVLFVFIAILAISYYVIKKLISLLLSVFVKSDKKNSKKFN